MVANMKLKPNDIAEAVVFFEEGKVFKEMLYQEFEAVLDRYVPASDLANKSAQAVYLRVNHSLQVTAAVFFTINFDYAGFPDSRWNVPLQHLADISAKGPDLGAGPIRLSCYSQCAIAWQQKNLWNPEITPANNTFVAIKKAIQRNRLGILFEKEKREPASAADAKNAVTVDLEKLEKQVTQQLRRRYQQEFRDHVAQLIKDQRLKVATINANHQEALQRLKLTHIQREESSRAEIAKLQRRINEQLKTNQDLKTSLEQQARKVEGIREYFEHKLVSTKNVGSEQLRLLKENFELELETKLSAATQELEERLQMREIELMYRNERESSLHEEIKRLHAENQSLLNNSGDQLLQKLHHAGVNFVAYQPGAGHINIPIEDMATYVDAPTEYAAKRAGVSIKHYKRWLEHYQKPVCQALKQNGEICGCNIEKVAVPSDFHPGESDRCMNHQTVPVLAMASMS